MTRPGLLLAVLLLPGARTFAQPTPSLPWNIKRVGSPKAWPAATGKGVKVCVLDTGADLEHDGLKIAGGFNAVNPQRPYKDGHGHGTHVAGTIAAQDVGRGVIGVAPDAEIYAVKVLNDQGFGSFSSIIAGLQWCVENGMELANVSLGAPIASAAYKEAIQNASAAGLAIVAAAGNSGAPESGGSSVVFPAAYPETIAVSAMDRRDKTADFSSRGPEVDFIAPGVEIRSTKLGGDYAFKDGTSMAAPHVTGLAALYLSAGGERGGERVRDALKASASTIAGTPATEQGAGVPDAESLVRRNAGAAQDIEAGSSPISFDKPSYSWTGRVRMRIFARAWNTSPHRTDSIGGGREDAIRISTRMRALSPYRFIETGPDTGVFAAELRLTGFPLDADGDGRPDTAPRTSGNGPADGLIENKGDDAVTVSWRCCGDRTLTASVPISMGRATLRLDAAEYGVGETAALRLADRDMDLNPDVPDRAPVHLYSDSDLAGVLLYAAETAADSGIFQAAVSLTSSAASNRGRLYVRPGDLIYAAYTDRTLPPGGDRERITAQARVR